MNHSTPQVDVSVIMPSVCMAVALSAVAVVLTTVAVVVTVRAVVMTVIMVVVMPNANTMMVVAAQDEQVQDIDANASKSEEKHKLAVDCNGLEYALDCFCYQDTCHCPAAED